jgi:hypothetical protein
MPCLSPFKKNPGCQCSPQDKVLCFPCSFPKQDLVVSWTNPVYGDGSATLVYTGIPYYRWATVCSRELIFDFYCLYGGLTVFSVSYFISGSCPGGQKRSCVSLGDPTDALILDAYSCSPLFLRYKIFNCYPLLSSGYTSFTVTE